MIAEKTKVIKFNSSTAIKNQHKINIVNKSYLRKLKTQKKREEKNDFQRPHATSYFIL